MPEILQWFRASDIQTPSRAYGAKISMARCLTEYAHEIDAPPQYECHSRVRCRGQRLSRPVYWRGRQWAVTRYGIERRDGTYVIDANRYDEHDETKYSWVRHMAGKCTVDLLDFAEALRIARRIRQYGPTDAD